MLKIKPKLILVLIIYNVLFQGLLINVAHVPGMIVYFSDILLLFLLIFALVGKKKLGKEEKLIRNIVLLYMAITLLVYMIEYQNILYYISGFRSLFRAFIFFFLCILFFNTNDIEDFENKLDRLFYFNAGIMLIQYFAFDLEQDYLGGVFGTKQGCNGPLNIFFVIIVSRSVINYMLKKEKLSHMLLKCGLALGLAGLAELKYFFIEFLIIVVFVFFTTGFSFRKLAVVIFSIVGLIIGIAIIDKLFGMGYVFNLDFIIKDSTTGGYTKTNDLSRGAFVATITDRFLLNNFNKFFGLGLGNCDADTVFVQATPFYRQYGFLHYNWFASMHTFIEQGWCGLIFYCVFFILIIIVTLKIQKKYKIEEYYVKITSLLSILFLLVFFYNQTLRQEIAYLVMLYLSAPFVVCKEVRAQC